MAHDILYIAATLIGSVVQAGVGTVMHQGFKGIRKELRKLAMQQASTSKRLRTHVRTPASRAHPESRYSYPHTYQGRYPPPPRTEPPYPDHEMRRA